MWVSSVQLATAYQGLELVHGLGDRDAHAGGGRV